MGMSLVPSYDVLDWWESFTISPSFTAVSSVLTFLFTAIIISRFNKNCSNGPMRSWFASMSFLTVVGPETSHPNSVSPTASRSVNPNTITVTIVSSLFGLFGLSRVCLSENLWPACCLVGFLKQLGHVLDLCCTLQSGAELNHAGRAARGHNLGSTLFDSHALALDNALRRLKILHEIGSSSARATIGIRHLDILDTRQACQNFARLFGDSCGS